MNALIHLATGFGIATAVINTEKQKTKTDILITSLAGLFVSFTSHAVLDYMPHCYPINSKVDFMGTVVLLILLTYFCVSKYQPILFCCLVGSVLPDIIDLLPSILNKQLGLHLPIYEKIFFWHWKTYSGSIYTADCFVSDINISLVLLSVIGIMIAKRNDLKQMYFEKRINSK